MSKATKITVIILFLITLALGAAAVYVAISLQDTADTAPDDSEASGTICCPSFECNDGVHGFGEDYNYGGGSCDTRQSACNPYGGYKEGSNGNQCTSPTQPGQNCGEPNEACCQPGDGCRPSLQCQTVGGVKKCVESGNPSCNGTPRCDNNGCYCDNNTGCSPIFARFGCPINGSGANQVPTSCNDANKTPGAEDLNRCVTIQYDVSQCSGTNANVVWIDDDGTRCSSNDGGLQTCLGKPNFSLAGCGAPVTTVPTTVTTIPVTTSPIASQCSVDATYACSADGRQVTINWTVGPDNFGIDRIVVRANKEPYNDWVSPEDIWLQAPNVSDRKMVLNIEPNKSYGWSVALDDSTGPNTFSERCRDEAGSFLCLGRTLTSTPTPNPLSCGNNTCDVGESCDGITNCAQGRGMFTSGECRTTCSYCGDGITQAGEFCDDGNTTDVGDTCTNSCTIPNFFTAVCGNGIVEPGEECDSSVTSSCGPGGTCNPLDCKCRPVAVGLCGSSCTTDAQCPSDHSCYNGTCKLDKCIAMGASAISNPIGSLNPVSICTSNGCDIVECLSQCGPGGTCPNGLGCNKDNICVATYCVNKKCDNLCQAPGTALIGDQADIILLAALLIMVGLIAKRFEMVDYAWYGFKKAGGSSILALFDRYEHMKVLKIKKSKSRKKFEKKFGRGK